MTETAYVVCTSKYDAQPPLHQTITVSPYSSSAEQGTISSSACPYPTDYKMTGGGFSLTDTDVGAYTGVFFQIDTGPISPVPTTLTEWQVEAYNNDTKNLHSGTVYATCV